MSDEEEEVEYDALVEEATLPTSSLAVTVDFADLLPGRDGRLRRPVAPRILPRVHLLNDLRPQGSAGMKEER